MRILVTGGAGFIGSHFARRLLHAGDEVVVLDKLTYSGNRANLPKDVEFHEGDIAEAHDIARAARGCAAIVNFAAETHVDRSILTSEDFGRTEFRGTQMLLEHVRGSCKSRPTRSTAASKRAAPQPRRTRSARRARTAPPRPRAIF